MDLEQLLCAAQGGQPGAWDRLVPVLIQELHRFFSSRFGDDAAEDLTQITLLAVVQQLPGVVPRVSLSAWVFGVARNQANHRLRKRYKQADFLALAARVAPTLDPSPSSALNAKQRLAIVREEMAKMPPHHRRALEIELEGGGPETHARKQNIQPGTARVRTHRAHALLRKRIQARQRAAVRSPAPTSTPTRQ